MKSAACAATPSTTRGAALPTVVTAMPEPRSISELPSTSSIMPPPARATYTGRVELTPALTTAERRAASSCDFGPGSGVRSSRRCGREVSDTMELQCVEPCGRGRVHGPMMAHRLRRAEPAGGLRSQSSSGAGSTDPCRSGPAPRRAGCRWSRRRCRPSGRRVPSREVNRPPASVTIGTSAAMSCTASSGSAAMSTAPSATQHVGPEVAVRAGAPAVVGQAEELVVAADLAPRADAASRTATRRRAWRPCDTCMRLAARQAAAASRRRSRPPPTSGGSGPARRPGRAPARRRRPARSGWPTPARRGRSSWCRRSGRSTQRRGPWPVVVELLALDGVAGTGALELVPDELLGRPVGVGDRA